MCRAITNKMPMGQGMQPNIWLQTLDQLGQQLREKREREKKEKKIFDY